MAITYVESWSIHPGGSFNSNAASTFAPGDLLVMLMLGGPANIVVTDNVNNGPWTTIYSNSNVNYLGATNIQVSVAYKVCNATLINGHTLTLSWTPAGTVFAIIPHYTGFIGLAAPTGDLSLAATPGFSGNTALAAIPFNTTQINELVATFVWEHGNATGFTGPGAPWNTEHVINQFDLIGFYDSVFATPGSASTFGITLAPSDNWGALQVGFYDSPVTFIGNTFVGANTLNVSPVTSPGTNLFSFTNPAEHINVSTTVTNVTTYNIVATGANTNIAVPTVADTIVYNAGNSTYTHTISGNAIPTITVSVPADILH